jgi:hypothetical protein
MVRCVVFIVLAMFVFALSWYQDALLHRCDLTICSYVLTSRSRAFCIIISDYFVLCIMYV